MIYTGSDEIRNIYLGNEEISAIYAGEDLIYPMTVTAWSVDPLTISAGESGTTQKIKIAAMDDWTITSSESWVTFSVTGGTSGRSRVEATIAANAGPQRTATITVADTGTTTALTISVTQEAIPFQFTPDSITIPKTGTTSPGIHFTISSPYAYSTVSDFPVGTISLTTGSTWGQPGIAEGWIEAPALASDSAVSGYVTVTISVNSAITLNVEQKAAELPSNSFLCNYNAKLYDPATHTLPKTEGQLFNEDMVLNAAVTSYTTDHITVDGQHYEYYWNNGDNNPFNLQQSTPCTIIAKTSKGLDVSGEHSFMSCRSSYGRINWILFNGGNGSDNNTVFMHNSNRYASQTPSITLTDEPNIWAMRIDNGSGYAQSFTDNTTGTTNSVRYDGNAAGIGIFTDSYNSAGFELWRGDFYWLYISKEALTDNEIQQVIDYNEQTL